MTNKPDLILFDWDGTLVDTIEGIIAYNNMLRAHYKMPLVNDEILKGIMSQSSREYFRDTFGDEAETALQVFRGFVHDHHLNYVKPMVDAVPFMEFLTAQNIPFGIVSNKNTATLIKEIEHLGWSHFFAVVVGAGEAARDKPTGDPLKLALEKLNFNREGKILWYVGDTDTDMKASIDADFRPIFIEHGFHDRDMVMEYNPYIIVSNLIDLQSKLA
jgi:phosphoglycolate phosphatase